jgi:hypothetical protein
LFRHGFCNRSSLSAVNSFARQMDVIKKYITESVVDHLSQQLSEEKDSIRKGLELGVNIFLASVIKFDKGPKNILSVLNDGGHSGELLKNLDNFTANREKSKLLETIGQNIVNYFIGDKLASITEKLAQFLSIKESSASSLLNVSAPVVLGFLGKTVREENLSATQLKNYLLEISDQVVGNLPLNLQSALNLPNFKRSTVGATTHQKAVKELNQKKENWSFIWPWILLVFVGVMIYYFSRIKEVAEKSTVAEVTSPSFDLKDEPEEIPVHENKVEEAPKVEEKVEEVKKVEPEKRKEDTNKKEEIKKTEIPAGFEPVPTYAFARESAEITREQYLVDLLQNLMTQSDKKIVISPLKGSGPIALDRAYAIRDFLIDKGVGWERINIDQVRSGYTDSGVVLRYQ